MSEDFINPDLEFAKSFVNDTGCNIFLTGRAGTGKTTFLKNLEKNISKRMIITAPTGVAAINAGGVTLHSFFQLPFGPFIPVSDLRNKEIDKKFKFSREKKNIMRNLDLLVIDEISMVRGDVLDAVDLVLRRYKNRNLPFGGVQLLMIGDLNQLPPVVKKEDFNILKDFYKSIYFFSSHSLQKSRLVTIELKHIYRQSDEKFIEILNKVRENRLDEDAVSELNKRYIKDYIPKKDNGYITLTTHNYIADSINQKKLDELDGSLHILGAEIMGDFPKHAYPAPLELELKIGSQVMFLKNDNSKEKLYFNGKIGNVKDIEEDFIVVETKDRPEIVIEAAIWENIKYRFNEESFEIEEEIVGKFVQFPLKLAWAITIHKSQGLTLDKAIIDSKDAFAHGQTYVALSRCRSLQGMILSSPISLIGVKKDKALEKFDEFIKSSQPDIEYLNKAKSEFQQKLLLTAFNFSKLKKELNHFTSLLNQYEKIIICSGTDKINKASEISEKEIFIVSEKFLSQLKKIFLKSRLPEKDEYLRERVNKASAWFQDKFEDIFGSSIEYFYFESDNKEVEERLDKSFDILKKEIYVRLEGFKAFEDKISFQKYIYAVSKAGTEITQKKIQKSKAMEYSTSDIENPEIYLGLKEWRIKKALKEDLSLSQILHQKVLLAISMSPPENIEELKKIKGVGKKTMEKYGSDILGVVLKHI